MTLLALTPLIFGCAVAGGIITWPIAEAAGRRSVAEAPGRRDRAEMDRILTGITGPAPLALQAAPTRPRGHRAQHRLTWRRSLVAWWRALPVQDVDAPVRAAMARTAAPLAIAAGVAVAEGARVQVFSGDAPDEVDLLHLAGDWRVRGTGPIPVVEVFSGPVKPLIGAAA